MSQSSRTPRILLCDGNVHVLRTASSKLVRAGYEVTPVKTGLEALDRVLHHDCDMLITEWKLPDVSGETLCESYRAFPYSSQLPLVLLSDHIFEDGIKSLCERFHLLRVMSKPFSPNGLLDLVDSAFPKFAVSKRLEGLGDISTWMTEGEAPGTDTEHMAQGVNP